MSPESNRVTITFETESERIQVMTVLEALQIFSVKNQEYNDGWKCYGAYGATFFIKDRANRIWRSMKKYQQFKREDALDLINICCFAIRSQMEGNLGGEYWTNEEVPAEVIDGELEEEHVCAVCGDPSDPCPRGNHNGRLPRSVFEQKGPK